MVGHSEILLSKCAQFRQEGEFIDVYLKVREEVFSAHRIVLAASSDYFHAMFAHGMKESNQEVIELKDESISAAALKIVLDSIYNGDLQVNDENVLDVLVAADHLQVTSVVQHCCDYLQTQFVQLRFDVQTYCQICTIADRHGLKDLQEATQCKMASMYKEICESEEFLFHMDADQLLCLLSRDDLSVPSETFVFTSVMQWIKHKKEERMTAAAKVIGGVRLGLVDIKEVIRELNTEEMQRVPEIHLLLHESLLHTCMPSVSSKFAVEKSKLRSTSQLLVAVPPGQNIDYFDFELKIWKPLGKSGEGGRPAGISHYCAETVGNTLYVAGGHPNYINTDFFSCYDLERNVWKTHPYSVGTISNMCTVGDYLYTFASNCQKPPQRYSLSEGQWQSFANVKGTGGMYFYNSGATALHSDVFVLYGKRVVNERGKWYVRNASLHCFDHLRNVWEEKGTTCHPHFGSSLFVVNGKLYVAGGKVNANSDGSPYGNPAPVEVYDEENNKWSVVDQKHIPENKLGAVEVDRRVFFIINKFPIDSGIRIPPGEVYPVSLHKWEKLGKISGTAALCYAPIKTRA